MKLTQLFATIALSMLSLVASAQEDAAKVVEARVFINVSGGDGATESCLSTMKAKLQSALNGGRITVVGDEADADYRIEAKVTSEKTTCGKLNDEDYWTCLINYTYEVKNLSDGTIKSYAKECKDSNSEKEKAVNDAEKKCGEGKFLINAICPLQGQVIEVNEKDKKGNVESLYINIGELHKVQEGEWFDVCSTRMIAGRTTYKTIAKVEIKSIEGDDVSLCKVNKWKKGREEIAKALENGETLIVKSGDEPETLLSKGKALWNSL